MSILKQGHNYNTMQHDGKLIEYIYRGGRCYYLNSPYSFEATQALMAAFPQNWTAIRDYGRANSEIVGYMNAYAVEDPKIAYSLVDGIGTRWINTNGTFMNSGVFYIGDDTADVTLDMQCTSGGWIGVNGILQYNCPIHPNRVKLRLVREGGTCYIYIDGAVVSKDTFSGFSGYFGLFKLGDNNNWFNTNPQGKLYGAKLNKNGVLLKNYIPYIKNGQVGLLNLVNGDFDKPSSGSFTIFESPTEHNI